MKKFVKSRGWLIVAISFLSFTIQAQTIRPKICKDDQFNCAYYEFADMLDGKLPLSVKRAIFLVEWAYLDGKLNYKDYCSQIDTAANAIKRFIAANRLDQISTGKNVAIFEYFVRPYSMNSYKSFTYDFNDFAAQEDFTNYFVTKLMRTHSGQCRSLPMYYKVLADEISAEAHITLAPQHLFVRHRHETDPNQWRNVELTTQSLSREIFYIEHFGITDEMIRNKVYLYPLSDRETVAYLLSELTMAYLRKYKTEDYFVMLSCKKSIEYFPQNILALIYRCNTLNLHLKNHLDINGNIWDEKAISLDKQWLESSEQIKKLGYKKMNDETYKKVLLGAIQSMREQGMSEEEIKTKTGELLKADNKTNLNINP